MIVKFYCDIPKYCSLNSESPIIFAYTKIISSEPSDGFVRVAFNVDLPIKEQDVLIQGHIKSEILKDKQLY